MTTYIACSRDGCLEPATYFVSSPTRRFLACTGHATAYRKLADTVNPYLVQHITIEPLADVQPA